MKRLSDLAKKQKDIFWDTADIEKLSDNSIIERIINYGDMEGFLEMFSVVPTKTMRTHLNEFEKKKRKNIRPAALNFAIKYFDRKVAR